MKIVNLTPHDITLRNADGVDTVIPKSGAEARVSSVPGYGTTLEGVPCYVQTADTFGEVTGLPPPAPGVLYLVSGIVGSAPGVARVRKDVLVPGTGPNDAPVRNEKGWIVAVTRLKMV